MNKPLVVLTGPTAVGKTDISIKLAQEINGEIISADSIQVYKYMDIGSAKVTPLEMSGIKHYLIDEIDPKDDFNVYRFQKMSNQYIKEIYSHGKIPIIVGGTGFYIQSVLYDIDFTEKLAKRVSCGYRKELELINNKKGSQYLHEMLRAVDAKSAEEIHANNVKRVIRALEYYQQTGQKISVHNEEQRQRKSNYNYSYFVLNDHRALLYQRINDRVDLMIEDGLVEEVKHLQELGYKSSLVSMQGIGYKEIYRYLEGDITLEVAIETIKKETRHFAKRQITWFKREKEITWINRDDYGNNKDEILKAMIEVLTQKNILER